MFHRDKRSRFDYSDREDQVLHNERELSTDVPRHDRRLDCPVLNVKVAFVGHDGSSDQPSPSPRHVIQHQSGVIPEKITHRDEIIQVLVDAKWSSTNTFLADEELTPERNLPQTNVTVTVLKSHHAYSPLDLPRGRGFVRASPIAQGAWGRSHIGVYHNDRH